MNQTKIRPNDFVKHIPSGESWVVCGINYKTGELVPCGWPFPSIEKIIDCELIESRNIEQPENYKEALRKEYLSSFIEEECKHFEEFKNDYDSTKNSK